MKNPNGNGDIYVFALFLSIDVAITKWVHNPFNNDAIAVVVAISHHVNSLICCIEPIYEGKKYRVSGAVVVAV